VQNAVLPHKRLEHRGNKAIALGGRLKYNAAINKAQISTALSTLVENASEALNHFISRFEHRFYSHYARLAAVSHDVDFACLVPMFFRSDCLSHYLQHGR